MLFARVSMLGYRTRQFLGLLLGMGAVIYFAYHTVQGERGLMTYLTLESRLEAVRADRAAAAAERAHWEREVRLLRPESLDPDMLDEQARRLLNLGQPQDFVIITR